MLPPFCRGHCFAGAINDRPVLKLPKKGRLARGCDADLLLLDKDTLALRRVMAKGDWCLADGETLKKGTFDR